MVGNVENTCIQESFRFPTIANWPWICNPRRRCTESIHLFFLSPLSLYLTNLAYPAHSNKMIQNPWPATGSHSTSFQLLLMFFFCKGSLSMKKVIMTVQPDLLQSASKRRQISTNVAPRVPTKKRKIIARWIIKKMAQSSPSPSDTNSNQVIHLFWNFFLMHIYSGWL